MLKKCCKCQSEFKCFNKNIEQCWCSKLKIPESELSQLNETYFDCLCEKCIKGYLEELEETSNL